MIVFNHQIVFADQPQLDENAGGGGRPRIDVRHGHDWPHAEVQSCTTPWLNMSGRQARFTSEAPFSEGAPVPAWSLEVKNVVRLNWLSEPGTIEYFPEKNFSPERLRFWTLHTMLPIALALEGRMDVLHVGCVEVENEAVIFSAPSYGGKSTLTGCFLEQGHRYMADDSLGIQRGKGRFEAVPSYPFHRPYRTPEELGHPVRNTAAGPMPVGAAYRLCRGSANDPVVITPMSGLNRFQAFHFATFVNFPHLKQRRFNWVTAMANEIPVFELTIPWSMDRLDEVYQALTHHYRAATGKRPVLARVVRP